MPAVAGCLDGDAGDAAPKSPPLPKALAPSWDAGDAWRYAIRDADGALLGNASYEVLERENATGTPTLRLRQTIHREGGAPVERTLTFDAATLDLVWNDCRQPSSMPDCQGRLRSLDFPLEHDTRWHTRTDQGDTPIPHAVTARHLVDMEPAPGAPPLDEAWEIRLHPDPDGEWGVRWRLLYDPHQERVVTFEGHATDGTLLERWTLDPAA